MKFIGTPIDDLYVVAAEPFQDHRGLFERLFCKNEFASSGLHKEIVQINHSITQSKGAIRGLHFQRPPFAEMKMVRCLSGAVYDVAVDLRCGSSTFLKWHAEVLTPDSHKMFVIPEGFAHGFQVLEPKSELLYFHTAYYNSHAEGGMRYDEPTIGVQWPLDVTDLSDRDRHFFYLNSDFDGIAF